MRDLGQATMRVGECGLALEAIGQAMRLASPDAERESKSLEDDLRRLEDDCRMKVAQLQHSGHFNNIALMLVIQPGSRIGTSLAFQQTFTYNVQ